LICQILAMLALALTTAFGPGWYILRMAWASLRRGILNQHMLLELGAFAGLAGGLVGLVRPDFPAPDFFGVAVFVTAYHILSGYVSLLVRTRTRPCSACWPCNRLSPAWYGRGRRKKCPSRPCRPGTWCASGPARASPWMGR